MSGIVLYIDHNPDHMSMIRQAIEGIGLTLFSAGSGAEGLARAERLSPAVVLLDMSLADMDACDVARSLRCSSDEEVRSVPIIAISTRPNRGDADRAIAAGCDIFMVRPLDIRYLWSRVEDFVAFSSA